MNFPNYLVRFYIRISQTQRGDTPTPLRLRVWIGAQKRSLYATTETTITPRQWAYFDTEGNPKPGAEPRLIREIDSYKTAANLVITAAVERGRIDSMTSQEFKRRIDGVKTRLDLNNKQEKQWPIKPLATPLEVETCANCVFRGIECRAPWSYTAEADSAPEFAAFNGMCPKRVNAETMKWESVPGRENHIPNEVTYNTGKRLEEYAAALIEAKEGGNNG